MSKNLPEYVQIRSFLAGNVDHILENLTARREQSKINADDLFSWDIKTSGLANIRWNTNYPLLRKYTILVLEKEALGLYVSGNPLEEYQPLVHWVRETTARDDIFLVLIEKIKKVFTKSGTMMLALTITTLEGDLEGLVFPKNALQISPKIQEKELFWVKGKISEKNKNKTKNNASDKIDKTDNSSEESGTQEFAELPKLIIEEVCCFEQGVLPLFDGEEYPLAQNRAQLLMEQDWVKLKTNPTDFTSKSSHSNPTLIKDNRIKILRIPNTATKEQLLALKNRLTNTPTTDQDIQIKLEVQDSANRWRKVKGEYWLNLAQLPEGLIYELVES